MATVFLYSSLAYAFAPILVDHKVNIHWDNVIYAAIGQTVLFFLMAYGLGLGVVRKGWNVNYTRKVLQIGIFIVPLLLMMPNILLIDATAVWGKSFIFEIQENHIFPVYVFMGIVVMLWTSLFSDQCRNKYRFLSTAFAAIDRPEDKGLTLRWLRTEIFAVYVVLAVYNLIYVAPLYLLSSAIVMLAIIVSSVGDGLAGIVGTKYGKHAYKVKALFTDEVYTRTWEGSFCIYAVTFIMILAALILYQSLWFFLVPMLLIVPFVATYAEAKSPHSWDNPLIICAILASSWIVILLVIGLMDNSYIIRSMPR